MNTLVYGLQVGREFILSHDPYVMDLVFQRLEQYAVIHRLKPLYTCVATKGDISLSVSAPLSAWFMKFVIVKFARTSEDARFSFSGKQGYAYAVVGKHYLCQWVQLEKMHRDTSDIYDLFLDSPTKLAGFLKEELEDIRNTMIK